MQFPGTNLMQDNAKTTHGLENYWKLCYHRYFFQRYAEDCI